MQQLRIGEVQMLNWLIFSPFLLKIVSRGNKDSILSDSDTKISSRWSQEGETKRIERATKRSMSGRGLYVFSYQEDGFVDSLDATESSESLRFGSLSDTLIVSLFSHPLALKQVAIMIIVIARRRVWCLISNSDHLIVSFTFRHNILFPIHHKRCESINFWYLSDIVSLILLWFYLSSWFPFLI